MAEEELPRRSERIRQKAAAVAGNTSLNTKSARGSNAESTIEREILKRRQEELQNELTELQLKLKNLSSKTATTVTASTSSQHSKGKSLVIESGSILDTEGSFYGKKLNIMKWITDIENNSSDSQSDYIRHELDSHAHRSISQKFGTRCHSNIRNRSPHPKETFNEEMKNLKLKQMISRQSFSKDLPHFDGDPVDWPNFIAQYRTSCRIAGFTDEENQCRLQKCLKGTARKCVQSLLILPQNVSM